MQTPIRILALEDSGLDAALMEHVLHEEAFTFRWERVDNLKDFRSALDPPPAIVLTDFTLPDCTGLDALALVRARHPALPVVFVSGSIGEERAISCLKAGATDYVLKDRLSRLGPVVLRALQEAQEYQKRLAAEEALRKAARTQQALLKAATEARVVPWSVEDGTLILGHSAEVVLGYPLQTLPTDPEGLEDFIHPEDRNLYRWACQDGDSPQTRNFECRMRCWDGSYIWTRWSLCNHPFHGVFQDISEQRHLLEQLIRSQRLEALGSLVAGISHDFNNLLQVIQAHGEQLPEKAPGLPGLERSATAILQATSQGRNLIQQLLTFARRKPLERKATSLNALVHQCGEMLGATLPSGVLWKQDLDPGLPVTDMDPEKIHQVLANLVINARDAMEGSGQLRVATGCLRVGEALAERMGRKPGTYLWLEVADTGPGIPQEHLARLFEPFFTTKGEKGTGLGLAVAQGIVEQHGGWIGVRSRLGRGTMFRVLLPMLDTSALDAGLVIPEAEDPPSSPGFPLLKTS